LRSAILGGSSEVSDLKHAAAAGAAACSHDEQAALPPQNAIELQRESNEDSCDLLSPKTLFPDDSNHASLSSLQLPGEQHLTQIVASGLKLQPDVALQIARSMKATVAQNFASRADFRAQFFATRGPQQLSGGSTLAGGWRGGSGVGHALAAAERAVQVKAARAAEEEEEKFHARVVAAQGGGRRQG
jgi:hypothetical protein